MKFKSAGGKVNGHPIIVTDVNDLDDFRNNYIY